MDPLISVNPTAEMAALQAAHAAALDQLTAHVAELDELAAHLAALGGHGSAHHHHEED